MVDDICSAVDDLEADAGVGALVVTGEPPAFCAGADLSHLGESRRTGLLEDLRGLPPHRPLTAAHDRRGERCRGRRRHEPGARVRRAARRSVGSLRHPVPAARHPPRRRPHLDDAQHHRTADHRRGAAVRRGDRRAPTPSGSAWCGAASTTTTSARPPSRWRREWPTPRPTLVQRVKATIADAPQIADHGTAVERELVDQVWSIGQPAFAERLAAMQQKISSPRRD